MSHPRSPGPGADADSGVGGTVRALVALARAEQLGFLAAAIAYYAFVSLVPLLVVALAAASALAGPAVAAQVLAVAGGVLSPEAVGLVDAALTDATAGGTATVAGLAVLTWSGLRVFRGLDTAFARIYGAEAPRSLLVSVWHALLTFLAIGLAVGAVVVVSAVLPAVGLSLGGPARSLWLAAVLPAVFLPVYYVFPDAEVSVREALPGAVVAGLGWTALGVVFGVYVRVAGGAQLYGVLAGVVLVLTWFYVGGLLLLVGAALNTVLAGRRDRQLQQGPLRDASRTRMHEADGDDEPAKTGSADVEEPVDRDDLTALRRELDQFRDEVEDRTVRRDDLEADLKRYVRRRQRRGHARGWGPYLVLLYGTAMTIGAFALLNGVWAFLAMVIVWLSTLGLYALMVVVGLAAAALGLPGRLRDALGDLRD